jgi:SHS2 domain-containing protein
MQDISPAGFQERNHGADAALEVHASDLTGLFHQAALGMYALMGVQTAAEGRIEKTLETYAPDEETLLVAFLTNLLILLEQDNLAATGMQLVIMPGALKASLDCNRAELVQREIKAVTFHELSIRHGEQGYETVIVFDL